MNRIMLVVAFLGLVLPNHGIADDIFLKSGIVLRNVKVTDSTATTVKVDFGKRSMIVQTLDIDHIVRVAISLQAAPSQEVYSDSLYQLNQEREHSATVALRLLAKPRQRIVDSLGFWMATWEMNRDADSTTWDWQYELRAKVVKSADEYLRALDDNGMLIRDGYLDDYLQRLLIRICGVSPLVGKPGYLSIHVVKDPVPNGYAIGNGAVLITTGLMTLTRTETELIGVIAHEVGHEVFDHNLENYKDAKTRETLSSVFAAIGALIGGASVPRGYQQSNPLYYEYLLQRSMRGGAWLLYSVSKSVLEGIGAYYTRKQESKCDLVAKEYLAAAGLNPDEYGDVLKRLGEYSEVKGASSSSSVYDTHAAIATRLRDLDYRSTILGKTLHETIEKSDTLYDKNISECLIQNAMLCLKENDYEGASVLCDRVLRTSWAIEDAFVAKAIALRHTRNTTRSNEECLALLDQADRHKVSGYAILNSERGLLFLRLGRTDKALTAFRQYEKDILTVNPLPTEELEWARKMIARCRQ